ncbi:WD repeat-containing protein 25 isoform X1 [Paramormyrops kingsleyae]|uniref:WD repeat-containing protein 25 isoform X1 n=1 Tax=Paramormyrops kingsleyae TaxID=1676925 RepID=UPI003B9791A9
MASLVAYEDSDTEDESTTQEGTIHQNSESDFGAENSLGQHGAIEFGPTDPHESSLSPQGGGQDGQESRSLWEFCYSPWIQPDGTQDGVAVVRSLPQTAQGSSCVGPPKRPLKETPMTGIRPYVPKRQRLSQQVAASSEGGFQGDGSVISGTGSRLLTEVSEIISPFLRRKSTGTELPRRVRLRVQAHQGPVNTVQWCPVPHFSHLLLSASMDLTAKVWDGAGSGRCLFTSSAHSGAVRDASWMPCGRRFLTGSFDNSAIVTDVETGQVVVKVGNQFKVTCLTVQPSDPNIFLCGGFSPEVKAWDIRTCKVVRSYQAGIQQTLDILFLPGGKEFVTSSDSVSRDSADRTLIAWDFQTTAKVSNQIFHERYTCPSMALHPQGDEFVAQTNGNYMALFSARRPYRMNKRKRYEGHRVEGYAVGCEFSADGTVLLSGSSSGSLHFYDQQSSRQLRLLHAHQQACVCASMHPVLPAVMASCDWGGELCIWH